MLDLHAHTTASDGLLEPAELVNLAIERNLLYLGVTDHESTEGVAAALVAAEGTDLTVIPGVELSCDVEQGEVHVLGYFVPYAGGPFQTRLGSFRAGREGRARQIVERLTAAGAPIDFRRVREVAGEAAIGRPHIAQALVEAGHVRTVAEAFDRLLARGQPGYVPRQRLTPPDAVRAIVHAGGVASLAHPVLGQIQPNAWQATFDAIEQLVEELKEAGLRGIEVYYQGYAAATVDALASIANDASLIPTGGSDFHGRGRGHGDLGSVAFPRDLVDSIVPRLRAARMPS